MLHFYVACDIYFGGDCLIHYGHMVRVLHCAVSQAMTEALGEMELTSAQGRVMGYLAHTDQPPCARDIEEEFNLSHPTVSGLLSRLEKKNFIEFRPDDKDGRCKRIYILPKGLACHERIHKTIQENEARIVCGFTPDEKAQFADFLARAARNMGCAPSFRFDEEEPKK